MDFAIVIMGSSIASERIRTMAMETAMTESHKIAAILQLIGSPVLAPLSRNAVLLEREGPGTIVCACL